MRYLKETTCSFLIYYLIGVVVSFVSPAIWAGTVAQGPLFLTTTVKPNIMLMLDNSGSMNITVPASGISTPYNSSFTYPRGGLCSATPLPANNDPYGTGTDCINAGGTRSGPSGNRRCSIVYGTSIPNSFYGRRVGSTTGTQCFSASKNYRGTGSISSTLGMPTSLTTNAQVANWLNWYYSDQINILATSLTRLQIVKNSANALLDGLNNDVRMGFTTFTFDDGGQLWEPIDDFTATKKANIKNRIAASGPDTNTPLAETIADIGRYFATGPDSNVVMRKGLAGQSSENKTNVLNSSLLDQTIWSGRTATAGEPGYSTKPIQYSCQKSFALILTDGLPTWDREALGGNTYLRDYDGDCSGSNSTQCTGVHDMKRAYGYPGGNGLPTTDPDYKVSGGGQNSSDYFDDVTQALYEMDLRPDLRNPAKESANAKNNLTTYVVGFADSTVNPTVPGVNPLPKEAAEQGGGKFVFAGNEGELTASLIRTFQSIRENVASSSSVAANSGQFQTNTLLFQAVFNSTDWSGDIRAFNLLTEDTNGNGKLDKPPAVTVTEDSNNNGVLDTGQIDPVIRWTSSSRMPSASDRQIFTWDAGANTGIEFLWNRLNNTQKTVLDSVNASKTGPNDSPVLNYLRGDQSNEGSGTGEYRIRSSLLGDVINSDPLFVGGEDLGYSNLPEGTTYGTHVNHKQSNPEMLYVGANDGMLHAFNVEVNTPPTADEGREVFAYIPNAAISQELASLTNRTYTHRYFVDGAPKYGDVFYDGNWHTLLIGSMGAGSTTISGAATGTGGHGIFALDITDPESFNAGNVLWEFTNRQDVDLGYTLATPSVVRMANGVWAVILANGYNSPNGKAVLYVLNAKTGAVIKKIQAEISTGTNGLSTPTPVDVDGDRIIDYIYAGDLKGNLWKFNVTSNDPNLWAVAYSGNPLYTAFDTATPTPIRQVITSKPAVVKATAKEQNSGLMIFFGTGKYYEDGDHQIAAGSQIQTFYGVWDICDKLSAPTCDGRVSGRSSLVEQKILNEISLPSPIDQDVRITTNCEVAFGPTGPTFTSPECPGGTNKKGWYMDLESPANGPEGERVISNPVVRGNVVVFTTLIPINETCVPDGTGWFMEMSAGGARFVSSPIDINKDGKVNADDNYNFSGSDEDISITGLKSKDGIIDTPTIVGSGTGKLENKYSNSTSSNIMQIKECPPEGCPGDECDKNDPLSDCYECPPGLICTPEKGSRRSWRQL